MLIERGQHLCVSLRSNKQCLPGDAQLLSARQHNRVQTTTKFRTKKKAVVGKMQEGKELLE